MSNKQTFKLNMPEINLYIIVIGISSIILLYYNLYVGCLFFCIFVYMVFHNWRTTNIRRHEWTEYIQNLSLDIDETTKKEMYTEINYKEKEYTIIYNVIKNDQEKNPKYLMILYWIDKTEYLKVKQNYDDEKNAMMLIQVDGYDEVLKSAAEDKRALINVEVEKILSALELNSNGALRRTSKDKFFLVMHKKELKKLEAEKFSILDTIRHIDYGNNLPVTISIGIGIDGDTLNENLKLATGALDLALGRGGDQAVVKTKDKFVFYGGKSKAVEKKTKVKSRLIGHALREVIQQSDQVYIMGHKYPDMDAMGAAVGVYDICKSCNKTANIVLQSVNESIEIFINKINENNYYKKLFIGKEEAIDNCTKNTLVVVVDTHRPNYTECEELLKLSEKVVVIDHHRRGVEFINDAVLLFHEIYVSSTCEMVTELVQYMDEDVTINKLTAEGLLAGISLDTKNFAFKTGVRTFEAASYLRKVGADTIEVKKFFNSDVKDFIIKAEIIQSTKIINNRICLAYSSTEIDSINVIIAQTADELLNIKEVEASFVLGEKDDTIFISARSLGQINVHVLMEKLGGGGHIDIAGAQLKNVSLKEAYKMVNKIIEEYLEEEE